MPMNKLYVIFSAIVLTVLSCACSEEEDILPEQRRKIESYLESTHTPRLIPETELEEDSTLPYYSVSGGTVYRYIANVYDPERPQREEVTASSLVTITFRMYVFTFANIPQNRLPEFSNDPQLEAAYIAAGTDVGDWPFEPFAIDMRHGGILKGLRSALLGCRQGDQVEAYMTYNMAYGDAYFSIILKESPVLFAFTVESVE